MTTPAVNVGAEKLTFYSFEKENLPNVRTDKSAEEALKVFKSKLCLPDDIQIGEDDKRLLMAYVKSVQLNIVWYIAQKDQQLKGVKHYRWASLALLLVLPLVVFLANILISQMSEHLLMGSVESAFAMITGLITALLAFQQAFGESLRNDLRVKEFWKASSELKQLLYTFQDKWKNKASDNHTLKPEFIADVQLEIAKAKAVAQNEQDQFFLNYTVHEVNVANLLSSARTAAAATIDKFQSVELTQKLAAEKKAMDEKMEADKMEYQAKLDAELKPLEKATKIKQLTAALKAYETEATLWTQRIDQLKQEAGTSPTNAQTQSLDSARTKLNNVVELRIKTQTELNILME